MLQRQPAKVTTVASAASYKCAGIRRLAVARGGRRRARAMLYQRSAAYMRHTRVMTRGTSHYKEEKCANVYRCHVRQTTRRRKKRVTPALVRRCSAI